MVDKSKKHAHMEAEQTVSKAMQSVLRQNLAYMATWEQAARTWDNIEGVHQTRVAFRRLRSALSIFRAVLPEQETKAWADGMRDLATGLGRARDLDVFISETLAGVRGKIPLAGASKLEAVAFEHRAQAYQEVRAMLDSDAHVQFKQDFGYWVENRGWDQGELSDKQRHQLERNVIPFARKLLDRHEHRVLDVGTHVDKQSQVAMHGLRIQCKKLRYAAEFFAPLFVGMDLFINRMRGLQDLLGVLNDISLTRDLLERFQGDSSDQELNTYAGAITGWQARQRQELLDGFERHWEEFTEARHPWWRKDAVHALSGRNSSGS